MKKKGANAEKRARDSISIDLPPDSLNREGVVSVLEFWRPILSSYDRVTKINIVVVTYQTQRWRFSFIMSVSCRPEFSEWIICHLIDAMNHIH